MQAKKLLDALVQTFRLDLLQLFLYFQHERVIYRWLADGTNMVTLIGVAGGPAIYISMFLEGLWNKLLIEDYRKEGCEDVKELGTSPT